MENITINSEEFHKHKNGIDGCVFWRELPNNKVEVKFIKSHLKYISHIFKLPKNEK